MDGHPNYLNYHGIDPSRIEPAKHFVEADKMGRIDRAPGNDSIRPGQAGEPPQMTAKQAARVIKAMGKHIVDGREPRPGALDIVDAVARAVSALEYIEEIDE